MIKPLSQPIQARAVITEIAALLDTSPSARRDAQLLLGLAVGRNDSVMSHEDITLTTAQTDQLNRFIHLRKQGYPVSRLRGFREFFGLNFWLNDACLDPRPDSEILVETALSVLSERSDNATPHILDLGCGTGCLLLSVLKTYPDSTGLGIDCQALAIAQARANAAALALSERSQFKISNWTDQLEGQFDLCLCNPPYIAEDDPECNPDVRAYDPELALFGGTDGLDAYRIILDHIPYHMKAGGVLILEIGYRQADAVRELAECGGLVYQALRHDLAGHPRCLVFSAPA